MQEKEFLNRKRESMIDLTVFEDLEEEYNKMSLEKIKERKEAVIKKKTTEEVILADMEMIMKELESEKSQLEIEREEIANQGHFGLLQRAGKDLPRCLMRLNFSISSLSQFLGDIRNQRAEETIKSCLNELKNTKSILYELLNSIEGVNRENTKTVDAKIEDLKEKIKGLREKIEEKNEILMSLEISLKLIEQQMKVKDTQSDCK